MADAANHTQGQDNQDNVGHSEFGTCGGDGRKDGDGKDKPGMQE